MYILKGIHIYPSAQKLATIIFHNLQTAPSPSPHLNNHVRGLIRDKMHSVQTNVERLTKDPRAQVYIREDYWEELVAEGVFVETAKLVLALECRRRGIAVERVVVEGPMVQAWQESRHMVMGLLQKCHPAENKITEIMLYLSALAVLVLVSPPVFRMLGFEANFPVDSTFRRGRSMGSGARDMS